MFFWACLANTATATIPTPNTNCSEACDCADCCDNNYTIFYNYQLNAQDWWAWYNAGQPQGITCETMALFALFGTDIICILSGGNVINCLAAGWMTFIMALIVCKDYCMCQECGDC